MGLCNFFTRVKNDIDEGMFDTEMFKHLQKKYKVSDQPISDDEKEEIDAMLATPDARPALFDGTLEAWLLRISLWGKIKITHKNPEDRVTEVMSTDRFLNYIDDQERNATYGLWIVEALAMNKIRFYRKFWSYLGKEITEEMIVDIDLRPDLKTKLNKIRGFLGWKLGI